MRLESKANACAIGGCFFRGVASKENNVWIMLNYREWGWDSGHECTNSHRRRLPRSGRSALDAAQPGIRAGLRSATARIGLTMPPEFGPDLVFVNATPSPAPEGCETCRRIKDSPMSGFTQVILIGRKPRSRRAASRICRGSRRLLVVSAEPAESLAKIHVRSACVMS